MNKHEFEEKVAYYAKKQKLLVPSGIVAVALSGGADSVALLRVLLSLGVECRAFHCNFGLRGEESDRDESFVRSLCLELGVSLEVKLFDLDAKEEEYNKPQLILNPNKTNFYDMSIDDFTLMFYEPIKPQLKLELGI